MTKNLRIFFFFILLFFLTACTPSWARSPKNTLILAVSECNNHKATVNRGNILPIEECVQDLVSLEELGLNTYPGVKVSEMISQDIKRMFEEAEKNGHILKARSGWRSCADQEETYAKWVELGKQEGKNLAQVYSYRCGESSHHLGTSVDLVFLENEYNLSLKHGDTKAYKWLIMNSWKYGCLEEYPHGKEEITGLQWEPWHFRCGFSKEDAKFMFNEEVTIAEFIRIK